MGLSLPMGQQITATFLEQDSTYSPFPVTGPITWTSSDTAIATVTAVGNGATATITPVAPGDVEITGAGDGVSASIPITVTGEPIAASIQLAPPVTPA